ncbi:hypothetical protein LTR15_005581 [Elasticomyces elasticus]|nr:hypothetical protein LTR15_005581 [Elasticomyces elasticus]
MDPFNTPTRFQQQKQTTADPQMLSTVGNAERQDQVLVPVKPSAAELQGRNVVKVLKSLTVTLEDYMRILHRLSSRRILEKPDEDTYDTYSGMESELKRVSRLLCEVEDSVEITDA